MIMVEGLFLVNKVSCNDFASDPSAESFLHMKVCRN